MSSTLAVIFDFDDTLLPDSTTKLLEEHNIHSRRFWSKDVKALVSSGYDPTLAWMKLFLDNVGQGKPLGQLTNAGLRSFGSTLENSLYPGLGTFFRDLRRIVAKYPDIDLEFYIISGGLQPVIESCKLIQENFHFVYGSQLAEEQQTGAVRHIKRCVTFTEKTRYLFEINKGLDPKRTLRNPYLVNKDVPLAKRRVPFKNMIYAGDGVTDIPCFSLLRKEGGTPFGVFDPTKKRSAKRALLEFLKPARVISMHAPRYGKHDELGSLIRMAVATRCAQIKVERERAEE